MGRVIWSPSALADAEMIAAYIARDSADHAALFMIRLFEAADRLAEYPQSGRIIPELNAPDRRELFVASYRIMYRIEGDDAWIVAIIHGARDWPPPTC